MEDKNYKKLSALLDQRRSKLDGVINFYQYFENFTYIYLKDVVRNIDNELVIKTNENLRIFSENPYEKSSTPYFVMVQLFTNSHRRNTFYLDNSESLPMIKFEGDEFSGLVKTSITFGSKISKTKEYNVNELNNYDKVFDIILNFLESIYNL